MSEAEDKAAKLVHPVAAADGSGLTGVHRTLLTGSPQSFAVPSGMVGKFCTLTVCSTDDMQYAFGAGTVAPALVKDQVSVPGTGSAAAGKTIFSRTSIDRRIPLGATFLSFVSTGTSGGYLEFDCSELLN